MGSQTFQARYPACEVRLQEVETFDAYRALRRGDIDVLCNWFAVDEPDLTAGTAFADYPRALAVAATHRLATQDTVSIEDLANEDVALLPPNHPVGGLRPDRPPAHAVRTSDPPQPARPDHQRDPLTGGARAHRPPDQLDGPHLQPRRHRPHPDPGPPPIQLGLVWCTSRENPRIRALNEIARSLTAAPGTAPFRARQP